MTTLFRIPRSGSALALILASLCMLTTLSAMAGPGAHGPNGEHLDAPAPAAATTSSPAMAAQSELFELVAELHANELTLVIDRFDTNEPVLGAVVEVELGTLKARAVFHADNGVYIIADPAMLKDLSRAGEHALVYTVMAGDDSDLLEGTLTVADGAAAEHANDHSHLPTAAWLSVALILTLAAALGFWHRRKRKHLAMNTERSRP